MHEAMKLVGNHRMMTVTGMLVRYGLLKSSVWMGYGIYSMLADVSIKVLIGIREQRFLFPLMAHWVHTYHMMISLCSQVTDGKIRFDC